MYFPVIGSAHICGQTCGWTKKCDKGEKVVDTVMSDGCILLVCFGENRWIRRLELKKKPTKIFSQFFCVVTFNQLCFLPFAAKQR